MCGLRDRPLIVTSIPSYKDCDRVSMSNLAILDQRITKSFLNNIIMNYYLELDSEL